MGSQRLPSTNSCETSLPSVLVMAVATATAMDLGMDLVIRAAGASLVNGLTSAKVLASPF